jgi:hypothetical protein
MQGLRAEFQAKQGISAVIASWGVTVLVVDAFVSEFKRGHLEVPDVVVIQVLSAVSDDKSRKPSASASSGRSEQTVPV